jgi:hypothetical protein
MDTSSAGPGAPHAPTTDTYPLGVSRPPLAVDDLPEPEEVFHARRIGLKETVTLVIGPSLIALGLSIGSGEWLLAPLAIGQGGWTGIGFVALISILLQAFYNMEIGRYVVATGEVPSIGFGRVPPGFITGGWAAGAGDALFTFITGDIPGPEDRTASRWLAVGLMAAVFVITLFGRKISRTMELTNWILVVFILVSLIIAAIVLVPLAAWGDGIVGMFRPALPPEGVDATDLGAVAGFAAMASGLNYVFMNYYRDKGYGMGARAGYIPGLLSRETRRPVEPVGTTFRDTPENAARWRRWWRFLIIEMWVVFVPGALIGILMPGILVSHVLSQTGTEPTRASMPTYVAAQLEQMGEPRIWYWWALLVGFLILFTTQLVVFEMLVRNMVDALYGSSAGFRRMIGGDPRRFYYPFMVVLAIVISLIIFQALPTELVQWSANMSNLAAIIIPFALMFLIARLPGPAKGRWWSYLILVVVIVYFGFFFANFLTSQLTGGDLSFW